MLTIPCPQCSAPIEVHEGDSGTKARCLRCGCRFVIGQAAAEAAMCAKTPTRSAAGALRLLAGGPLRTLKQLRVSGRSERQPSAASTTDSMPASDRRRTFGQLRTIAVSAFWFIALPAALIFFLVVVCAPKH